MIYMQLKKYVLPNENDREKEIYKNFKHHFFRRNGHLVG